MAKEILATKNAPEAIGPYSQGVKVGDLVFTSGQLPVNPETGEMYGDIENATKQALENVKAVLEAGGSSLDKAVKVTVFLNDINDFAKVNEIYATYFKNEAPARSAYEVANLPKGAIVEIEAIGTV